MRNLSLKISSLKIGVFLIGCVGLVFLFQNCSGGSGSNTTEAVANCDQLGLTGSWGGLFNGYVDTLRISSTCMITSTFCYSHSQFTPIIQDDIICPNGITSCGEGNISVISSNGYPICMSAGQTGTCQFTTDGNNLNWTCGGTTSTYVKTKTGTVIMSGSGVSASDTVDGYPISLQIGGSLPYSFSINGASFSLIPILESAYTSNSPQQIQFGQYIGLGIALCVPTSTDPTGHLCQETATILWVQSNLNGGFSASKESMQVGILRYPDGSIENLIEHVGYVDSTMTPVLPTAEDLVNELISVAK